MSCNTTLSFIFRNSKNASPISKIGNVVAINMFISFPQEIYENILVASSVFIKGKGSIIFAIPLNNKTATTE